MTTPSVTLKSLKNTDTGIDVSVPRFQEEEAPLGGVSILYEVSVLTTLDLYKTRLHRDEDVVHFSIFKAYREIEDLAIKLNKKFPNASIPHIPKASNADKITKDEKVKTFDNLMSVVAKNPDLCHSPIFTQFIGINSQKSFNVSNTQTLSSENTSSDQDDQELFHKMKNVEKKPTKLVESKPQPVIKSDLFDEPKTKTNSKGPSSQSLFDEFDDDDLFSSKPTEKKPVQPKQNAEVKKTEMPVTKKPVAKPTPDKIDDSEIIIKDRKFGDVSLFDEQDFGDYITKEEEALFLVTAPTNKPKQNFLLSPKNEILSPEKDIDENDNLDDLLNLVPLPTSPHEESSAQKKISDVIDRGAPTKPVPLPRKKSLSKMEPEIAPKPEVMPRKVFLNKNEDSTKSTSSPTVPPKPSLPVAGVRQTKPKPPVKPKPPPKKPNLTKESEAKSTDLDTENANKPESNDNAQNSVSNLSDQLKELDILKYIEQEQKSLDSNLDLFD